MNWQRTLSDHLVDSGFVGGVGHLSVFHHKTLDFWTLVHGDDSCSAGKGKYLDWLEATLAQRYEIKTQRLGEGKIAKGDNNFKYGQVLNHVVRYTDSGWELEADLRHAELIVEQLCLTDAKSANTAGIDQTVSCAAGGD